MRKTILYVSLLTALTASGGSSNSSSLGGNSIQGNFVSSTVDVEQRFLYALNIAEGSVSAFLIQGDEEGGGGHGDVHQRVLAQDGHGHGGEGEETEGLSLLELDGSPYTLPGAAPIDMVVEAQGRYLYLLDAAGNLSRHSIDGLTGLLKPAGQTATGVANPRRLRL